jgi:hypothetical protein
MVNIGWYIIHGGTVLLKSKVIGRKKIKGSTRDKQKYVTYDYGRTLDLMIITMLKNCTIQ